ncbi:MAG: nitrous oxide-stimulated promoter family protein [Thomasclavelia sp.]|uniref:nitrous oxide-stimulated promoter family protein n=1 Tax=Thomasclavelia sp. TaxID=3025757 RepID=UPI0039A1FB6F
MTTDQEKELISIMIKIYEDGNKVDLSELRNYAFKRIEYCPRKDEKTFCSSCPIHCYQKEYRQRIKKVMKYSGKRILFKYPIITIKHLINTIKYAIKN